MVYLKFYDKEKEEFPQEKLMLIPTQKDVIKIVNKLVRHFKLSPLDVTFRKRKAHAGEYYKAKRWRKAYVNFHKSKFNLLIVIHEVAHHFLRDKTGKSPHTKKLMTLIRRLVKYCRKMDYWGLN